MFWLLLSLGIPVVVVLMLFFSAMDDFWQIVTLRIDVSRLFGDLVHVIFIVGIGLVYD